MRRCEVCQGPGPIFEDHSHESKVIRGYLCNSCNISLSIDKDVPENLRIRAAAYDELSDKIIAKIDIPGMYADLQRSRADKKRFQAAILRALADYLERPR
jgi:Recombination endonuclease VII